jgi:hypothetical protein
MAGSCGLGSRKISAANQNHSTHSQPNRSCSNVISKAPSITSRRGRSFPLPAFHSFTTTSPFPFPLSFSSLIPFFRRSAASTAVDFSSTFHHSTSAPNFRFRVNAVRTYAKGKRKNMGPKKQVVQEKVLLGRPGNNLKSGIVSRTPSCRFNCSESSH